MCSWWRSGGIEAERLTCNSARRVDRFVRSGPGSPRSPSPASFARKSGIGSRMRQGTVQGDGQRTRIGWDSTVARPRLNTTSPFPRSVPSSTTPASPSYVCGIFPMHVPLARSHPPRPTASLGPAGIQAKQPPVSRVVGVRVCEYSRLSHRPGIPPCHRTLRSKWFCRT